MYNAIIIEDEPHAANLLEQMLESIAPFVTVVDKCPDLPTGVRSIKRLVPDIVFLDIELPIYDGTQLLEFFNPEEIIFHIIFITASNQYAIRAFEMNAVDYLMKPLQEDKLENALKKLRQKKAGDEVERIKALKQAFQAGTIEKMIVPLSNGYEIIKLSSIVYFKAEGSYTMLHFSGGKQLLVSKNLKHFENMLSGMNNYLRAHRSYLVNIDYVKKITYKNGGELVMEDNSELPVSAEKVEKIIELLYKV
jgi:two-component system, LytTR family, response regulator